MNRGPKPALHLFFKLYTPPPPQGWQPPLHHMMLRVCPTQGGSSLAHIPTPKATLHFLAVYLELDKNYHMQELLTDWTDVILLGWEGKKLNGGELRYAR